MRDFEPFHWPTAEEQMEHGEAITRLYPGPTNLQAAERAMAAWVTELVGSQPLGSGTVAGSATIEDGEGNVLPTEPNLQFINAVSVVDDPGGSRTVVTLPTGGGGGGEGSGSEESSVGPAESVAQLNAAFPAGPLDGQVGIIRLGTGPDQEDVEVVYDGAREKWVSDEYLVMRNTDQNGPTVGFYLLSQLGRSYSTGLGTGSWWNFVSLPRLNNAMAAGLALEYRQEGFLLRDSSGASINVGAYIFQVNDGDPNPNIFEQPMAGGWAQTAFLTGGGTHPASDYQWKIEDWTELLAVGGGALPAATKTSMYPVLVGTANHDGVGEPTGNGGIIDYTFYMRFAG